MKINKSVYGTGLWEKVVGSSPVRLGKFYMSVHWHDWLKYQHHKLGNMNCLFTFLFFRAKSFLSANQQCSGITLASASNAMASLRQTYELCPP